MEKEGVEMLIRFYISELVKFAKKMENLKWSYDIHSKDFADYTAPDVLDDIYCQASILENECIDGLEKLLNLQTIRTNFYLIALLNLTIIAKETVIKKF